MSHQNKALVRRWYEEVWNHRKLEVIDELFPATFEADGRQTTPEQLKQGLADIFEHFLPGGGYRIEDEVAEGDKVVVRFSATGTLAKPWKTTFAILEPTGKPATLIGMRIFLVRDGKIAEWWTAEDLLGFSRQFGLGLKPE